MNKSFLFFNGNIFAVQNFSFILSHVVLSKKKTNNNNAQTVLKTAAFKQKIIIFANFALENATKHMFTNQKKNHKLTEE